MSDQRERISAEEAQGRLAGQTISSVEFPEDGNYVVIKVGDLTLYGDAPTVYASHGVATDPNEFVPPEDLKDAWERFQRGDDVEPWELRALDEARIDHAVDF